MEYGLTIRKYKVNSNGSVTSVNREQLNRQIITLHKKIKKNDDIITEYSIEKDPCGCGYHVHMNVKHTDSVNLINHLQRFIGGSEFKEIFNPNYPIYECTGRYGKVKIFNTKDKLKFSRYINKYTPSRQLF